MAAGIYMILNTINNKKYIGQSWDLKRRKSEELKELRGNKFNRYSNHPLQNAFNLYGEEVFEFTIIYEFDTTTQETLDNLEIQLIQEYKTLDRDFGYNLKSGGSHGKHSQETKDKISKTHKGKVLTEEHKKKIAEKTKEALNSPEHNCNLGSAYRGKHLSEEHKKKISDSNIGRKLTEAQSKHISEVKKAYYTEHPREKKPKIPKMPRQYKKCEISDETRMKLSESKLGENNPFYGKTHTEASKKKMSACHKDKPRSEETKKKIAEGLRGKKFSEEHRESLRKAWERRKIREKETINLIEEAEEDSNT